jgi:hypothetical protein
MKVNPRLKVYLAKYTGRLNLFFAIAFVITMMSAYEDYLNKLKHDPTIPWYGMFFKVHSSWDKASPFISQS